MLVWVLPALAELSLIGGIVAFIDATPWNNRAAIGLLLSIIGVFFAFGWFVALFLQ